MSYRKYKYQPHRIPRHHNECRHGEVKFEDLDLKYDPIADPNSATHERAARRLRFQLWQKLSALEYDAWMLRTHKPNATWQDIEIAAQFALDHLESLDCACILDEHCPICDSLAHILSIDEFEPEISIGKQ